jgi:uncharacterized membrane protein
MVVLTREVPILYVEMFFWTSSSTHSFGKCLIGNLSQLTDFLNKVF